MNRFKHAIDYQRLRNQIEHLKFNSFVRKSDVDCDEAAKLYEQVLEMERKGNNLGKQKNDIARLMKGCDVAERPHFIQKGKVIKQELAIVESDIRNLREKLYQEARNIPNYTHPSVPLGDESCARVLYETEIRSFTFKPKDHTELTSIHDMLDVTRAGKVSGSGNYFLKNLGAMLELAIVRYAMDICTKHGFTPVTTPDIIRHSVLEACGFSPRSDDPQTYFIHTSGSANPDEYALAATAEFPLAVLVT